MSSKLTHREIQVAELVADGYINKQIADELHISPATVKSHMQNIYRKLKVKNKIGLMNKMKEINN